MSRLTVAEQLQITAISAERKRREVLSRLLQVPPFRWRFGDGRIEQLLIVPQDLRTPDPSLWLEIRHGQFGLAGSLARLEGRSPFDIVPPSRDWQRALHGFGWLRHLHATDDPAAFEAARQLAIEWVVRNASGAGRSWHPDVLARRVISWLSHAGVLLEGADEASYDVITASLARQLVRLSSSWRETPAGRPRLMALTALVLADLCVAGHDSRLPTDVPVFVDELRRQILPDGGHVSRNPSVLVELLLDFLPLRECFRARSHPVPPALAEAIADMLAMLRHLRLGDGLLARFNGVGIASPASLGTVLAYAEFAAKPLTAAEASGYVRLERGETVVVADCGSPPPMPLAGEAGAGCASFELSSGRELILANGGFPGAANADWVPAARSTASHNTLVLGEVSSSRLIIDRRLENLLPGKPLRGPGNVTVTRIGSGNASSLDEDMPGLDSDELQSDSDDVAGFEVCHDGYLQQFGVLHRRRVTLEATGRRIVGNDWLKPPRGVMRHKQDVPFAIHFHLFPGVKCERAGRVGSMTIATATQRWRFVAEGARVSIEESMHFADSIGPLKSVQIVLRGASYGEIEVRWALTRLA
ncbi:MAG: heparinase II/III family protein [Hyphomicrobiaceae bacterium]|nr:heparinase II/III family protein [Hyphomicrobiaceae bacterium]